MPYADPGDRREYHREYMREYARRYTPEQKVRKLDAHRRWAARNPEYKKRYYEANKHKWHARNMVRQYKFTADAYAAMLAKQKGACALCGTTKLAKGKTRLSVDHCHATGVVRGLLCGPCNSRLGTLEVWYVKHRDKIHGYLGRAL